MSNGTPCGGTYFDASSTPGLKVRALKRPRKLSRFIPHEPQAHAYPHLRWFLREGSHAYLTLTLNSIRLPAPTWTSALVSEPSELRKTHIHTPYLTPSTIFSARLSDHPATQLLGEGLIARNPVFPLQPHGLHGSGDESDVVESSRLSRWLRATRTSCGLGARGGYLSVMEGASGRDVDTRLADYRKVWGDVSSDVDESDGNGRRHIP